MSSVVYAAYKIIKVLAYPLTWILLLLGLALFWSGGRHTRRLRGCLVLALAVAYGLSLPPVSRTLVWTLERQFPAPVDSAVTGKTRYDAVVVLAGGVARRGGLRSTEQLQPFSLQRLLCGRELMTRGVAPVLVFSGGNADPFRRQTPEATVMARTLASLGNTPWPIELETRSRTTYENAAETQTLLGARRRIALVTSALHMPRAMAHFTHQDFAATAFPCGFAAGPPEPGVLEYLPNVGALRLSTLAINEWIGWGLYRLVGRAE
jgi:uncharacterized SAM-binding protein YcdF (DUF218 family)